MDHLSFCGVSRKIKIKGSRCDAIAGVKYQYALRIRSHCAVRNGVSRNGSEKVYCSLLKVIAAAQERSVNEPFSIITDEGVVSVAVSLLVVHHVELGQIFGCVPDGEGGADPSFVPLELHFL